MLVSAKNRTIAGGLTLVAGLTATGLLTSRARGAERVERSVHAMGTTLALLVDAPTRPEALAASEAAVAAVQAAEARLSTWTDGSELSRFNAAPAGTGVKLSPALARDLAGALRCRETTGGAFSPGMGGLVRAWGLRSGGRRPADEEIHDLLGPGFRPRTACTLMERVSWVYMGATGILTVRRSPGAITSPPMTSSGWESRGTGQLASGAAGLRVPDLRFGLAPTR